ncbi:hypothetical protein EAG_05760, partial [Camponotus floridanus]
KFKSIKHVDDKIMRTTIMNTIKPIEIPLKFYWTAGTISMYIFTKKVSVDSYVINLMLLITAQYKYIALKLSMIFHDKTPQINHNNFNQEKHYSETNYYAEKQIQSLCHHHNAVIQ